MLSLFSSLHHPQYYFVGGPARCHRRHKAIVRETCLRTEIVNVDGLGAVGLVCDRERDRFYQTSSSLTVCAVFSMFRHDHLDDGAAQRRRANSWPLVEILILSGL